MNPNILNMKVYEYIQKISEYICPKNYKNPEYNILLYVSTNQFFGHNLYNGNNNLTRAIRSSFFIAQPVKSKNEQITRTKLKLGRYNLN